MPATAPNKTATATIADGAALSGAVALGVARLAAVLLPASWTTAALTFQASHDGVTFGDFKPDGTEYATASLSGGSFVPLDFSRWLGVQYVKVRSGTAGSPVNQGGDRDLTLVLVP